MLSRLTAFWFDKVKDIAPTHLVDVPDPSVQVVKRAKALPIEIVIRGYITGSLWRDYLAGKAGAYGIQHPGFHPVLGMRGCFASVMGLPLCHLYATLREAYHHRGLSFVRILQRCPEFVGDMFEPWVHDPQKMLMLTHPDGVRMSAALQKIYRNEQTHDPSDINRAREVASIDDPIPVGILYRNPEVPCYEDLRHAGALRTADGSDVVSGMYGTMMEGGGGDTAPAEAQPGARGTRVDGYPGRRVCGADRDGKPHRLWGQPVRALWAAAAAV